LIIKITSLLLSITEVFIMSLIYSFYTKRLLTLGVVMDNVARIFLSFSHDTIIIPLVILGYIWLDQRIFFNAICILLVSILLNFSLKITFQVPLLPSLNKSGFAFPSGHMQSSAALYGWLITKLRPVYKIPLIGLLIGIGLSLIHFGYHSYIDILGALLFGGLLIYLYSFLERNCKQLLHPIILSFSTFLVVYIAFRNEVENHLWMSYFALIGIIVSERLFGEEKSKKSLKNKVFATVICFTSLFIIKVLFESEVTLSITPLFRQTKWALIGFSIPFSTFAANYINRQLRALSG
jgi:undecaprenyl-diphosphatase